MKIRINLITVLLSYLWFIQSISTTFKYREEKKDSQQKIVRFYSRVESKEWQKIKFSDGNFSVQPNMNLSKMNAILDNQIIEKTFDVYFTPKYRGWIVYNARKVYEKKIQHGDYVIYAGGLGNRKIKVDTLIFNEEKSKFTILNYFRGSSGQNLNPNQIPKSRLGFLNWMNNPVFPVPNNKKMPAIYLKEYIFNCEAFDLEDFMFGSKAILNQIQFEKNIPEIVKMNGDVKEFKQFMDEENPDGKTAYIKELMDEINTILLSQPEWNQVQNEGFKDKMRQKLQEVTASMVTPGVEHLKTLPTLMNLKQFIDYFNDWFINFDTNWFIQRSVLDGKYINNQNVDMNSSDIALGHYLKHHLGDIMLSIYDRTNPIKDKKTWDVSAFVKEVLKISGSTNEEKTLVDRMGSLLNDFASISLFHTRPNLDYYISQIEGIDEILQGYAQKTIQFNGFAQLFPHGILDTTQIHKMIQFFFADPKSYNGKTYYLPIFERVGRNLLIL